MSSLFDLKMGSDEPKRGLQTGGILGSLPFQITSEFNQSHLANNQFIRCLQVQTLKAAAGERVQGCAGGAQPSETSRSRPWVTVSMWWRYHSRWQSSCSRSHPLKSPLVKCGRNPFNRRAKPWSETFGGMNRWPRLCLGASFGSCCACSCNLFSIVSQRPPESISRLPEPSPGFPGCWRAAQPQFGLGMMCSPIFPSATPCFRCGWC